MDEHNTFGARLKESRRAKKLTQKQLAEQIGAKHNSVSDWERGYAMPDPDTIVDICEVLDVSASHLLPSKSHDAKSSDTSVETIYVSMSTGDKSTDELRKQLHEYIDSLPDDELRAMTVMFRIEKN